MREGMRKEFGVGLLFSALAMVIGRFDFLPTDLSSFICGAFMAFGMFFLVVNLLPKRVYDSLLYRKWITNRKN